MCLLSHRSTLAHQFLAQNLNKLGKEGSGMEKREGWGWGSGWEEGRVGDESGGEGWGMGRGGLWGREGGSPGELQTRNCM